MCDANVTMATMEANEQQSRITPNSASDAKRELRIVIYDGDADDKAQFNHDWKHHIPLIVLFRNLLSNISSGRRILRVSRELRHLAIFAISRSITSTQHLFLQQGLARQEALELTDEWQTIQKSNGG